MFIFNGDFNDCIVAVHPLLLFCSVECKTLKTNVTEMITKLSKILTIKLIAVPYVKFNVALI